MAKPSGGGSADTSNSEFFLIIAIVLGVVMAWVMYRTAISTVVLGVRQLEALVISVFTSELDPLRRWMSAIERKRVTVTDLWKVSDMVGWYTRWIAVPALVGMGVWLWRTSPTERFRRNFTDRDLPILEAENFPWVKVSVVNDIASADADSGPWAKSQTERQFAQVHGLLGPGGVLDHEKAEAQFALQMGPLFTGFAAMSPASRALAALFATRAAGDFKAGDALLIQLAQAGAYGKVDLAGVQELWDKHKSIDVVKRAVVQHAYERTLLMALLEAARGGPRGKNWLPPNWFLWLKPLDRTLWYCLSGMGRQIPQVESGGPHCHFLMERRLRLRQVLPFVRNAVRGLEHELAKYSSEVHVDEDLTEADELLEIRQAPLVWPEGTPPEVKAEYERRQVANKAAQGAYTRDDRSS